MDRGTRISIAENLRQLSFTSSWIALYHLLGRPWWERAWVLQETTLAKAAFVYCGNQSQPWIVIVTAARIACDTGNMIFRMLVEQGSWEPQLFTFTNRNPIEQLVFTRESWMQCHREAPAIPYKYHQITPQTLGGPKQFITTNIARKCFLLQDKVYSVLGLLPTNVAESIKPNYDDPSEKVLKEAIQAYIGSLNIICYSQYSHGNRRDIRHGCRTG